VVARFDGGEITVRGDSGFGIDEMICRHE